MNGNRDIGGEEQRERGNVKDLNQVINIIYLVIYSSSLYVIIYSMYHL